VKQKRLIDIWLCWLTKRIRNLSPREYSIYAVTVAL